MEALSSNNADLLLTGFVSKRNVAIPMDILSLFISYIGKLMHLWTFDENEISNWFSLGPGQVVMNENYMTFDGLHIQCGIYPNGKDSSSKGYVQCIIRTIKNYENWYHHINYITIYYELYCFELNTVWKNTVTIAKNRSMLEWSRWMMKLSECKNQKNLTFGCYIDIIDKHSYKSNLSELWTKDIKMYKRCTFQWNIECAWLCVERKKMHFSENFNNDTFCLYVCRKKEGYIVGIKLLSLPCENNSIQIDYKINNNETKSGSLCIEPKKTRLCRAGCCMGYNDRTGTRLTDVFHQYTNTDELIVNVEIIIKSVNNNIKTDLEKCGIINRSWWDLVAVR
eukprot:463431_1